MGLVEETIKRKQSNVALVVPTIRPDCYDKFVSAWIPHGLFEKVDLILIEDNPTKKINAGWSGAPPITHLCWADMEQFHWAKTAIPRRSDTVRSFGYWLAWKCGYQYIMTLDDDCMPLDGVERHDIVGAHLEALKPRTKWFNTLSKGRPRGLPYKNVGSRPVALNHGLWTNVLDMDAPTQLVAPFDDPHDGTSWVVTPGAFFPMCGMNLMWRAEITVLMYHMLMGSMLADHVDRVEDLVGAWAPATSSEGVPLFRLPFDRFGDIWCGIVAKKILDMSGLLATTGIPYVKHDRASDPFVNLRKEANGIGVNEKFWQIVDSFVLPMGLGGAPKTMYKAMGAHIIMNADAFHSDFVGYFKQLGMSMVLWAQQF